MNSTSTSKKLSKQVSNIVPRLLNVAEAAAYLGRTPDAIRQLMHRGRLPIVRIDRRVQLDRLDLDLLIERTKDRETVF
jgi:excisionase family DNA binding protein